MNADNYLISKKIISMQSVSIHVLQSCDLGPDGDFLLLLSLQESLLRERCFNMKVSLRGQDGLDLLHVDMLRQSEFPHEFLVEPRSSVVRLALLPCLNGQAMFLAADFDILRVDVAPQWDIHSVFASLASLFRQFVLDARPKETPISPTVVANKPHVAQIPLNVQPRLVPVGRASSIVSNVTVALPSAHLTSILTAVVTTTAVAATLAGLAVFFYFVSLHSSNTSSLSCLASVLANASSHKWK